MSWSKEDKKIFESSEVFKNMEDKIIENFQRLKVIQANTEGVKDLNDAMTDGAPKATGYADALKGVGEAMDSINSSDDTEIKNEKDGEHHVSGDGYSVTVKTNEISDGQLEKEYFKNTIAELKNMAYSLAVSGNIKLAYKIERAIDEIIEVRDEN